MIGNILIWTGLILMLAGSASAFFESRFLVKLHKMSASDFSGASLVFIGMMVNGFEPVKSLLSIIFLAVWSPLINHVLAKVYVSRVKR